MTKMTMTKMNKAITKTIIKFFPLLLVAACAIPIEESSPEDPDLIDPVTEDPPAYEDNSPDLDGCRGDVVITSVNGHAVEIVLPALCNEEPVVDRGDPYPKEKEIINESRTVRSF